MQPFHFIHASRVQLDSPVIIPGECTPADRQLAEDASILAFRSLVDDCVAQDVDLLLLTGDTFGASLVTLREQMELEQGLMKLSDHGVAVVIVPGTEDPASAWHEHMQLPEGVALIDSPQAEPIRIFRDGDEVAAIFPVAIVDDAGRPHGCRLPQVRPGVFRIGLVGAGALDADYLREFAEESTQESLHIQRESRGATSAEQALDDAVSQAAVDYVAIGITGSRQTWATDSITLHNPGPLQALDANITSSCGASLVSVESDGRPQIEFIPSARIRWERLSVTAWDATSIEDLAVEMEQALGSLKAAKHEELWIVQWELSISPVVSSLLQASFQELWELIDSSAQQRPTCRHIVKIASHVGEVRESHGPLDEIGTLEDKLRADLQQLIEQAGGAEWSNTVWGRRIIRESGKLSPARLLPRVRHTVTAALSRAGLE